jgi:signal peptidase I
VDEPKTYPVRPGHYMMMGDNSPRSHDGRKWGSLDTRGGTYFDDRGRAWYTGPWDGGDRRPFEVPEHLLIGKAFFIYWPHGQPFWPNLSITRDFRFPFRPNVERMELIR